MADDATSPGTFSLPPELRNSDWISHTTDRPVAPLSDNELMNWLSQIMGGGMGPPGQGGMGGGNPLMGGMDPLSMGMGGNPLAMGAGGMSAGLDPYQAAGLRLRRNNEMNALRQNMANAHRGIGAAGGRDFSRHVENINDEMMALQEQKVQNNINNAFRASQDALAWARFNQSQDQDFWNLLMRYMTARGIYGGAGSAQGGSPGTFSGAEGGADTQGTLP